MMQFLETANGYLTESPCVRVTFSGTLELADKVRKNDWIGLPCEAYAGSAPMLTDSERLVFWGLKDEDAALLMGLIRAAISPEVGFSGAPYFRLMIPDNLFPRVRKLFDKMKIDTIQVSPEDQGMLIEVVSERFKMFGAWAFIDRFPIPSGASKEVCTAYLKGLLSLKKFITNSSGTFVTVNEEPEFVHAMLLAAGFPAKRNLNKLTAIGSRWIRAAAIGGTIRAAKSLINEDIIPFQEKTLYAAYHAEKKRGGDEALLQADFGRYFPPAVALTRTQFDYLRKTYLSMREFSKPIAESGLFFDRVVRASSPR